MAEDIKEEKNTPCTRSFDIQFLHNGDVRICGCRFKTTVFDELVIGNIQEASLKDLWFSEKVYNFRNKFFEGEFPPACQNCSFFGPIGYKRFYMRDLAEAERLRIPAEAETRKRIADWESQRPSIHKSVETGIEFVRGKKQS